MFSRRCLCTLPYPILHDQPAIMYKCRVGATEELLELNERNFVIIGGDGECQCEPVHKRVCNFLQYWRDIFAPRDPLGEWIQADEKYEVRLREQRTSRRTRTNILSIYCKSFLLTVQCSSVDRGNERSSARRARCSMRRKTLLIPKKFHLSTTVSIFS